MTTDVMTEGLTLSNYPNIANIEGDHTRPPRASALAQLVVFVVFLAAATITTSLLAQGSGLSRASNLEQAWPIWAALMGIVTAAGLPYLAMFAVILKLRRRRPECGYSLIPPGADADLPAVHAIQITWNYERSRNEASGARSQLHAMVFGLTASLVLFFCAAIAAQGFSHPQSHFWAGQTVQTLILSVATASATVFAVQFARCLHRIATRDDTAAMFSWATRALLFVIIADLGFFALLHKASGTEGGLELVGAGLLGIFTGVLGHDALRNMQQKVSDLLKLAPAPMPQDDTLSRLDGVTPDDRERLAEEGITTIADMAFAPTARLFFNTGYSLQRVSDWQDQSLLHIHVGTSKARELASKLGIRGATDLLELSRSLHVEARLAAAQGLSALPAAANETNTSTNADPASQDGGASQEAKNPWSALRLALGMSDGAMLTVLWRIYKDESVKHVLLHRRSAVSAVPQAL